jgi:Fe-S oxidoreductase
LREAKKEGAKTVEGLKKYMDEGLTIVVCEPGCASALNDDLADLMENTAIAKQLQKQVVIIDVFIANEIDAGKINVLFESAAENILIHGHCHQKALYGTKGMKTIFGTTPQNSK